MNIYEQGSAKDEILAEARTGDIVERVEFRDGIYVYLKGHTMPHKGLPTPEAIHAANIAKRLFLSLIKLWYVPYVVEIFIQIGGKILSPFFLKPEYQQVSTRVIQAMIYDFATSLRYSSKHADILAKIVSHIFEYDAAYRLRIQDLANETSKELLRNPQKEILRLLEINKKRDYTVVSSKFRKVVLVIYFALFLPPIRKAFNIAVENSNFKDLQMDENDRYWASLKDDYHYGHRTNNSNRTK